MEMKHSDRRTRDLRIIPSLLHP